MIDLTPQWSVDGDAPALIFENEVITYAKLKELSLELGDNLGSETRKLVFLEAANTPQSIAAYLACLRDGHAVFLFDPQSEIDEQVALYAPEVVARFIGGKISIERTGSGLPLHPDLRVLLSTSGSTGSPKFVRLSAENVDANARSIAEYLALTSADRAITSLKFSYSYGLSVVNSHLAAGASLVLTDASVMEPEFWELLRRHGATSFAGVPYTFEMLRSSRHFEGADGLRYVTQAGGRLEPDLVRHFAAMGKRKGWDFYVMYGQTEASPRIAYLPPEQAAEHPSAIGLPIPGGSLSIEREGSIVEGANIDGELVYRGPNVMMGYAASRHELGREKDCFELRTGDIGRRNTAGLFVITGRASRFIKPYGLRINLDRVEEKVRQIAPNAIVTGDDRGVVVAIADADTVRPSEVVEHVAGCIDLPATDIVVVKYAELPKLSNEKPDYRAVLERGRAIKRFDSLGPGSPKLDIFSRAFLKEVVREAGRILGLRSGKWDSVQQIYATLLGKEINPQLSFVELSGDSLSFINVSLALEEYLGSLPDGWEGLSVSDLQKVRGVELAL